METCVAWELTNSENLWLSFRMDILHHLRLERGRLSRLAKELGISTAAVAKWRRVPAERVVAVARITGLPREQLRPDLYASRDTQEAA